VSSAAGPSGGGQQPEPPTNLATAVAEVSERASTLIREEIELAKAEIEVKATSIAKGTVVGVVAGIFFATALLFLLIGCAWLLYYVLPGNDFTYFWGFFAMAVILVILGVIAGPDDGDRRGPETAQRDLRCARRAAAGAPAGTCRRRCCGDHDADCRAGSGAGAGRRAACRA
jgi:hypothetical protein